MSDADRRPDDVHRLEALDAFVTPYLPQFANTEGGGDLQGLTLGDNPIAAARTAAVVAAFRAIERLCDRIATGSAAGDCTR